MLELLQRRTRSKYAQKYDATKCRKNEHMINQPYFLSVIFYSYSNTIIQLYICTLCHMQSSFKLYPRSSTTTTAFPYFTDTIRRHYVNIYQILPADNVNHSAGTQYQAMQFCRAFVISFYFLQLIDQNNRVATINVSRNYAGTHSS